MKRKIISGVGAILLAGVLAAGVCCTGYASRNAEGKWFKNGDLSSWHWGDKAESEIGGDITGGNFDGDKLGAGGAILSEGNNNGISLMSYSLPAAEFDQYGISPQADSAYILNAVLTPANSVVERVTWRVSWQDPVSVWTSGKSVTDYVTVTAKADNALSANLVCMQPFGEKIVVTVTGYGKGVLSATCTCDYVKHVTKLSGGTLSSSTNPAFSGQVLDLSSDMPEVMYPGNLLDTMNWGLMDFSTDYVTQTYSSAYTLDDNFTVNYTVKFNPAFLESVSETLGKSVTMKTGSDLQNVYAGMFQGGVYPLLNFLSVEGVSEWTYEPGTHGQYVMQTEGLTINEAVRDFNGAVFLVMTATGGKSTFEREIPLYFQSEAFVTYANGMEFDQGNIIF